mmetsp:Transcript_29137/g.64141  ORF Transcript_29137/g.64141 Transcript_29137/m.64141 type:complete len:272 (+) Transcript_29137:111-926(+)
MLALPCTQGLKHHWHLLHGRRRRCFQRWGGARVGHQVRGLPESHSSLWAHSSNWHHRHIISGITQRGGRARRSVGAAPGVGSQSSRRSSQLPRNALGLLRLHNGPVRVIFGPLELAVGASSSRGHGAGRCLLSLQRGALDTCTSRGRCCLRRRSIGRRRGAPGPVEHHLRLRQRSLQLLGLLLICLHVLPGDVVGLLGLKSRHRRCLRLGHCLGCCHFEPLQVRRLSSSTAVNTRHSAKLGGRSPGRSLRRHGCSSSALGSVPGQFLCCRR